MRVARTKAYILTFLVSLPFMGSLVFLLLSLAQMHVSFILMVLILSLAFGPLFIVWLFLMSRFLVPVTGGMPIKGLRQWAPLYLFIAGFGLFWATLTFVFDTYLPFLDREARETTLPVLVILGVPLCSTLTRLRFKVADFINKLFGTEPVENSDKNENPQSLLKRH